VLRGTERDLAADLRLTSCTTRSRRPRWIWARSPPRCCWIPTAGGCPASGIAARIRPSW